MEELIQKAVETSTAGNFPINAHLETVGLDTEGACRGGDPVQQNASAGMAAVSAAVPGPEEGGGGGGDRNALSVAMDLSELGGDPGLSSRVLATLQSLVEVMNEEGRRQMEEETMQMQSQQGGLGLSSVVAF